jgi:uncharacterized protein (UPF0332 family)
LTETGKRLAAEYLGKAGDRLRAAEVLMKESLFDDVVSRAYYAAFHAAQAALLIEGQSAQTHHGVVTLFGLHLVKTGKLPKKLGRLLANLKDDRESGEYEVLTRIDRETAEKAFDEAAEFVRAVEEHLKPLLVP